MSMFHSAQSAFRPTHVCAAMCLGVLLLIGCRGQSDTETAGPSAAQPAESVAADDKAVVEGAERPTPEFLSGFVPGMRYAELREAIFSAGWLPVREPSCWDKQGSALQLCGALPEVEDCDARNVCTLWFAVGDGTRLQVIAELGSPSNGDAADTSSLVARSWALRDAPASAGAASCPSSDFDAFLQRYASDAAVRGGHTAPMLELGELYLDPNGNDAARSVFIAAEDYRDFDLAYRDGAYHYVDASGAVDPAPLPIQVETPSDNARIVRFSYGMSEGNSYRFEMRGGCWALTGDPEPPSP